MKSIIKITKYLSEIDLIEDEQQIKTWLSEDGLLKFSLVGFTKGERYPVIIIDLNRPYKEICKIFGLEFYK